MITRKEWQAYKKKHKIPDGLHAKISVGDLLEKYEKGKQTDADLEKLEKSLKLYYSAAKDAGHEGGGDYLLKSVNTEIAERQEAAARAPKTKPELSENSAKFYRGLVATLNKHHANLKGVRKALGDHPELFAKGTDEQLKAKAEKLFTALQSELDKMFAWCRDQGGDTYDISLAHSRRLSSVDSMEHADLIEELDKCLDTVKETADHIADKF